VCSDGTNGSKVSVTEELSCSAIDISASATSCRLAGVIGSRLAWTTDSRRVTEHSDTVASGRGMSTLGGLAVV